MSAGAASPLCSCPDHAAPERHGGLLSATISTAAHFMISTHAKEVGELIAQHVGSAEDLASYPSKAEQQRSQVQQLWVSRLNLGCRIWAFESSVTPAVVGAYKGMARRTWFE
jgi:hypothetical protein